MPEIHKIAFGGQAPPDPLAAIRGPTSKGRERKGMGREKRGEKGREGRRLVPPR